jgi:hypothetical protein
MQRGGSADGFSFASILKTPVDQVEVQLVLLNTVSRELDGLKKDPTVGHFAREFLRDDGPRARCMQRGVMIQLSAEEAEMEVKYGGRYRACGLAGPDAKILNSTWLLFSLLAEAYGASMLSSVVLVTNDHNMLQVAREWKLPCTTLDSLAQRYRAEPTKTLASAQTFLKCAGVTSDSAAASDASVGTLKEILAMASEAAMPAEMLFLQRALPVLETLRRAQEYVGSHAIADTTELRTLLGMGQPSVDDLIASTKELSVQDTDPARAGHSLGQTSQLIADGYALLDELRARVARSQGVAATDLGKSPAKAQGKSPRK